MRRVTVPFIWQFPVQPIWVKALKISHHSKAQVLIMAESKLTIHVYSGPHSLSISSTSYSSMENKGPGNLPCKFFTQTSASVITWALIIVPASEDKNLRLYKMQSAQVFCPQKTYVKFLSAIAQEYQPHRVQKTGISCVHFSLFASSRCLSPKYHLLLQGFSIRFLPPCWQKACAEIIIWNVFQPYVLCY